jgi:hypothetical protein
MPIHAHTLRAACAAAIALILAATLLGWAYSPPTPEFELVTVTGRATCGGRPLSDMMVVLEEDAPRGFTAISQTKPDGSFRMEPWGDLGRDGVAPGTYRVHFLPRTRAASESGIAPKYRDSATSDLVVHVASSDWNRLELALPDARRGPTLAHH